MQGWRSSHIVRSNKLYSRSSPLPLCSPQPSTAPCRYQSTLSSLKDQLTAYHQRQQNVENGDESDQQAIAAEAASNDMRWLMKGAKEAANPAWKDTVKKMVQEVVEEDKPLAYILGNIPFYPLPRPLLIRPPTLIPRPETEHWVGELAVILSNSVGPSQSSRSFRVLDIGTGSGCIPLSLAYTLSARSTSPPPLGRAFEFVGVDVSRSALNLAQDNLEVFNDLSLPVAFTSADLFDQGFVPQVLLQSPSDPSAATSPDKAQTLVGFDLIVSNPPYITESEYVSLNNSVSKWEDKGALVGGGTDTASSSGGNNIDGLKYFRQIISLLPELLRPEKSDFTTTENEAPSLVLEVGMGQAQAVSKMIESNGWRAEIRQDPWGIDRVVYGYRNALQELT